MISSKAIIHVSCDYCCPPWEFQHHHCAGHNRPSQQPKRDQKRAPTASCLFFCRNVGNHLRSTRRTLKLKASNFDVFPVCLLSSIEVNVIFNSQKCICFQTCNYQLLSQMIVWDPNMVGKTTRQQGSTSVFLRLNSCTSSAMLFRHHSGINYLSTGS